MAIDAVAIDMVDAQTIAVQIAKRFRMEVFEFIAVPFQLSLLELRQIADTASWAYLNEFTARCRPSGSQAVMPFENLPPPAVSDMIAGMKRPRFNLRDLLLAMACFAAASGMIAFCVHQPADDNLNPRVKVSLVMAPVIGITLGLGVGMIIGSARRATLIGGAIGLLPWLFLLCALQML